MVTKRTGLPLSENEHAPIDVKLDERVRRSKEVVLQTTAELLVEQGVSGLSVDEVCRRSGVAKTTIYRHWRTRSDLVIDGCRTLSTPQRTPALGSFKEDAMALLLDLAQLLITEKWPAVLPSIVDAAERDAELAAIHSQMQVGHVAPYLEVIGRAKLRNEITHDADAMAIVAQLVGPLFYRRWFSRESLDVSFVEEVVNGVACSYEEPSQRQASKASK